MYVCISYNMGTSPLPDMYARGPRAEGIHIGQSTSAHVITNMLHFCSGVATLGPTGALAPPSAFVAPPSIF